MSTLPQTTASAFQLAASILVSLGGGGAIVWAMSSWFGKIWAERILESDRNKYSTEMEVLRADYARALEEHKNQLEKTIRVRQAELDKAVFVTRVHFETEFEALKHVFAKLAELRLQMSGLRPSFSVVPASDTREAKSKRLHEALSKFTDAYNEFVSISENLSPFYPTDIFQEFEKCRHAASVEITHISTSGDSAFTHDWFLEGKRQLDEFLKSYARASNLIRERISKLSVIERL